MKAERKERAISTALDKVGAKHITAVVIAYVMQKAPYASPIIGGRKVKHLQANLEALEIVLTPEHIKYLESIVPFDPGFPTTMIVSGFFGFVRLRLSPVSNRVMEPNTICC